MNREDQNVATAIGVMGWLSLCGVSILFLGIQIYFWTKGTTLGKWLLGMWVVYEDGCPASFGTMLVRELIGKLISDLAFGLGYLWILLDAQHQGWHDKLVRTYVVLRRA